MRLLVAKGVLLEPEPDTYTQTDLSRTLRVPTLRDWIITCFEILSPIWAQTPEFFRKNGYKKDMIDVKKNVTTDMYGGDFFQHLSTDPKREAVFASAMKIQDVAPPSTHPQFPFVESLDAFESNRKGGGSDVFLVDVGGGRGQYLDRLIKSHPELPARNIFQDLASVVATVSQDSVAGEPMPHDFFTEQPVHGARFYHLRGILHDWPDAECIKILTQLRPGFKTGYSRLLVQSFILPETGCSPIEAMTDINMWSCCGMERTGSQFKALLEKAGFRILRIVKAEIGPFGLIEAEMIDRT